MRRFESHVQWIRHEVLKKTVEKIREGKFETSQYKIPKEIIPGNTPISRCCVYREREIIAERIELAKGPILKDTGIIETIESACEECSTQKYTITDSCRGCFAHRCMQACRQDAIHIIDGKAQIDYDKCIKCGRCKEVCSFNAIVEAMRPCIRVCKNKAIQIGEDQKARIEYSKCINCGACVYECPFGALSDKSDMVAITEAIETARKEENSKLYAVIAPSIVTQYNTDIGQIVGAIKAIGFTDVVEVALGADMVAYHEALEFVERVVKGGEACMTTSCCPAFVNHIKNNYKELSCHTSTIVSPMIAIARLIKKLDNKAKVIFIGPCTAKKEEKGHYKIEDGVDYVMTFEELEAIMDAYGIDIKNCEAKPLNNASYYGRMFARSGGVSDAVASIIKQLDLPKDAFRPISCSGIEEVDKALRLLKAGKNTFNFIEGMACPGGCIGGAASLTHAPKEQKRVEDYAKQALEKDIDEALRIIDTKDINLEIN